MAVNSANVNVFSYASTNVTTSAYVTLLNSVPINCSKLLVSDTSGQLLKIAYGLPGNEIDLFAVPVSGQIIIPIAGQILIGQRLAIKAINSNATTGFNVLSFINV